jgi:hypothetical protein
MLSCFQCWWATLPSDFVVILAQARAQGTRSEHNGQKGLRVTEEDMDPINGEPLCAEYSTLKAGVVIPDGKDDDDRNTGLKRRADIGFQGRRRAILYTWLTAQPANRWQRMSRITNQERLLMLGRNEKLKRTNEPTTFNKRIEVLFSFLQLKHLADCGEKLESL